MRGQSAEPVEASLFDAEAMKSASAGRDTIMNLATSVPPTNRIGRSSAWRDNDRIRAEGSRILVDAALAAGAAGYVQESVVFAYADHADQWIDETWALRPAPISRSAVIAEEQVARFTAHGGIGLALRFGSHYGPDSSHTIDAVRMARRRIAATFGKKGAFLPAITTDDAAGAVVACLGTPAGVYNIVDCEPLTRLDHFGALAESLGVPPPHFLPVTLGRLLGSNTRMLMRSLRVSNRRFVEATGWTPAYPSATQGWKHVVAQLAAAPSDQP
jgi:nucleoside-diphosphate-sugar epimerase